MERKTGFEPATLSLARRCSTAEPLPLRCRGPELNWGHLDFQSSALPTELPRPALLSNAIVYDVACVVKNSFVRLVRRLSHFLSPGLQGSGLLGQYIQRRRIQGLEDLLLSLAQHGGDSAGLQERASFADVEAAVQ